MNGGGRGGHAAHQVVAELCDLPRLAAVIPRRLRSVARQAHVDGRFCAATGGRECRHAKAVHVVTETAGAASRHLPQLLCIQIGHRLRQEQPLANGLDEANTRVVALHLQDHSAEARRCEGPIVLASGGHVCCSSANGDMQL